MENLRLPPPGVNEGVAVEGQSLDGSFSPFRESSTESIVQEDQMTGRVLSTAWINEEREFGGKVVFRALRTRSADGEPIALAPVADRACEQEIVPGIS